jgi:1-acyl-sn-glycerol-3-phosphate acyltransferase
MGGRVTRCLPLPLRDASGADDRKPIPRELVRSPMAVPRSMAPAARAMSGREGFMAPNPLSPDPVPSFSRSYRFLRGVLRLWFSESFRKIRLLGGKRLGVSGPAILAVCHPASFLDALILLVAFDRQVHCLIERKFLRGSFRALLARVFGMIAFEPDEQDWRLALETCCAALEKGEAVMVFADQACEEPGRTCGLAETAASLALAAESRRGDQPGPELLPINIFMPFKQLQSQELLIYIDLPLQVEENGPRQVRTLAATLESRYRENAFRIPSSQLKVFIADLEQILRAGLEENLAERAKWKQKAEDFRISGFVVDWAERLNYLNPGRLVAWQETLNSLREAQRRNALRSLKVEAAGAWLRSTPRRAVVWVESLIGLSIALYGLINHSPALLLLYFAGLLKKSPRKAAWLARALVVVACYACQLYLVAHYWGRAAAGYYAPSLPLSGLYLWRYFWLLRHRTTFVLAALVLPSQAARLRQMRSEFVQELDNNLRADAEISLGEAWSVAARPLRHEPIVNPGQSPSGKLP